jgi:hypothetical protein
VSVCGHLAPFFVIARAIALTIPCLPHSLRRQRVGLDARCPFLHALSARSLVQTGVRDFPTPAIVSGTLRSGVAAVGIEPVAHASDGAEGLQAVRCVDLLA